MDNVLELNMKFSSSRSSKNILSSLFGLEESFQLPID